MTSFVGETVRMTRIGLSLDPSREVPDAMNVIVREEATAESTQIQPA